MQIKLKKLVLTNFKGVKSLEIDLNHVTSIYGKNEAGKTTVFDAFLWLFFGKNSEDRSKFEIKRLDSKNNFVQKVETEVVAIIHVDGQEIEVKKVLRQKWVTKKGFTEEEYSGDENTYFWNSVPLKEGEFKAKITSNIGEESLFKLITNPFKFNTLSWQERRNLLIDIAGKIDNTDILDSVVTIRNKGQFNSLIAALNQGKTIDEFKKEIASKKKKIKDEMENIPSRVDEVRRGMPEALNFEDIKQQVEDTTTRLNSIQKSFNDGAEKVKVENNRRATIQKEFNQQVTDRNQKIFDLKTKMKNIEFDIKQSAKDKSGTLDAEIKSLTDKIKERRYDLNDYKNTINTLKESVSFKENEIESLRQLWSDTDSKQLDFDDTSFVCPACKQALPQTDIEEQKQQLTENFNTGKLNQLTEIENRGAALGKEIETLKTRIANGNTTFSNCETEIQNLQSKLSQLQDDAAAPKQSVEDVIKDLLSVHQGYQQFKSELSTTEALVLTEPVFPPIQTNEELKSEFDQLNIKRNELQKELLKEEQITKADARITELKEQEEKLAQELAALEGSEFAIMHFTKAKVDAIEKRINGKFKYVSFKMFDKQVNGGESECCDTLIKGVPFSDANNAARINAGIDIINTLCQHYSISAPIFIDNRESVTDLIDSDSQIVNLIVSAADKKLRIV